MITRIDDAQVVANGSVRRASILIRDAHIDAIINDGDPKPNADFIVDASDALLLPGGIDEHVHFRDPGLTHKADMSTESAAALLGGITSVMDMPNVVPQTITIKAWQDKMDDGRAKMLTNYAFYLGATNDNLPELLYADYSKVCAIKFFMGSSTGGMLIDNDDTLSRLFAEAPALLVGHCERQSVIKENEAKVRQTYGDRVPWQAHRDIRSSKACVEATDEAISLAKKFNKRLHILHLSTREEVDSLSSVTSSLVTGETCPAYLWFNDLDYNNYGPLIKCNPSIKSEADMKALREALENGHIQTIGSDHAPHTLREKLCHPYWQTPSGMPMVGHSLPVLLQLADQGAISLPTIARSLAENVADIYGVKDRGHIAVGQYADLTLVRRQENTVADVAYKCGWSPLNGTKLNYVVDKVFVNGALVVDGGKIVGSNAMSLSFNPKR